ncbi:hypothetical protein L596_010325 [Steinernema carpocapsae]|uniref:Granulins domain-containing protein n=1 Tax=Steinernema carpocapsae TaxID=34508 RepID=A0A4U5PIA1_STECR|nr:hypothetical protein L596_010325 [Steinernema carpocapsae]
MKTLTIMCLFVFFLALTQAIDNSDCSGGTMCKGGCCSFPAAVCCSNSFTCCPHGTTCDKNKILKCIVNDGAADAFLVAVQLA